MQIFTRKINQRLNFIYIYILSGNDVEAQKILFTSLKIIIEMSKKRRNKLETTPHPKRLDKPRWKNFDARQKSKETGNFNNAIIHEIITDLLEKMDEPFRSTSEESSPSQEENNTGDESWTDVSDDETTSDTEAELSSPERMRFQDSDGADDVFIDSPISSIFRNPIVKKRDYSVSNYENYEISSIKNPRLESTRITDRVVKKGSLGVLNYEESEISPIKNPPFESTRINDIAKSNEGIVDSVYKHSQASPIIPEGINENCIKKRSWEDFIGENMEDEVVVEVLPEAFVSMSFREFVNEKDQSRTLRFSKKTKSLRMDCDFLRSIENASQHSQVPEGIDEFCIRKRNFISANVNDEGPEGIDENCIRKRSFISANVNDEAQNALESADICDDNIENPNDTNSVKLKEALAEIAEQSEIPKRPRFHKKLPKKKSIPKQQLSLIAEKSLEIAETAHDGLNLSNDTSNVELYEVLSILLETSSQESDTLKHPSLRKDSPRLKPTLIQMQKKGRSYRKKKQPKDHLKNMEVCPLSSKRYTDIENLGCKEGKRSEKKHPSDDYLRNIEVCPIHRLFKTTPD